MMVSSTLHPKGLGAPEMAISHLIFKHTCHRVLSLGCYWHCVLSMGFRDVVVSQIEGLHSTSDPNIILLRGSPKVPLILGNPHSCCFLGFCPSFLYGISEYILKKVGHPGSMWKSGCRIRAKCDSLAS